MFRMNEQTGDAEVQQGDWYSFKITGIDDDWDLYYSVYKKDDRQIMFEVKAEFIDSEAVITVLPEDSDKLVVPEGKKYEDYYWGAKRCKDDVEDTLIIANKEIGELNKLRVYPKITEGYLPENDEGDQNG